MKKIKISIFVIIIIFIAFGGLILFKNGKNVNEQNEYDNTLSMSFKEIMNNETLKKYLQDIEITSSVGNVSFKIGLPVVMDNSLFKTMSEKEFFDTYQHIYDSDCSLIGKNEYYYLKLKNNYELKNIYNAEMKKVKYTLKDGKYSFKSEENSFYVAEIKILNKDTIKIIFM